LKIGKVRIERERESESERESEKKWESTDYKSGLQEQNREKRVLLKWINKICVVWLTNKSVC